MYRVSALLPSWDRSRQSTPGSNNNNNSSSSSSSSSNTGPSSSPLPPKTPGALDKVFGWAEKIVPASRINTSTTTTPATRTRYGRETYWPTTLDKECDKAARIIKSFCFDGFLSQESDEPSEQSETTPAESASTTKYIIKKIPPRIIQNAVGLAVFSCMRSGLWMSGSGGAGLITARKADGTWSPPSAIILHTAELAFLMGVDIYDCVLVINSVQTLELFTRPRLILGVDVSLTVGPLVAAGSKDPEIRWKEISETVLTYVKARGKHQAVQLDGSMVTERCNENERFYCAGVTILDILAGNIPKEIPQMRPLFEVIKAAEGRSDYDKALMEWLAQQPAPGDADIESPRESLASLTSPTKVAFGIPDANDPDPFGVIGLEMAGIEIREAGTKHRPTSTQFEFQPSPSSPLYGRFSRQSMDTFVSRSNRGSCMSARTQATAMTDACTQTDVASTADTTFSRANSDDGKDSVERLPTVVEPEEVDYTKVDVSILARLKRRTMEPVAPAPPAQAVETKEMKGAGVATGTDAKSPKEAETTDVTTTTEVKTIEDEKVEPVNRAVEPGAVSEESSPEATNEQDEDADDEDDEDDDEEPIICEVATASAQPPARTSIQRPQITQVIQAKGAIVTIPKRVPPPLPARSPARASRGSKSDFGDVSSLKSPARSSLLSIESRADDNATTPEHDHAPVTAGGSPTQVPRPSSPRHIKNSSSTCTAVPVDKTATASRPASLSIPPSTDRNASEQGHGSDDETGSQSKTASPSSTAVSATPQTTEPASPTEDDSDREPTTPQTAETDFDTASERQADVAKEDQLREEARAGRDDCLKTVNLPSRSASEKDRENVESAAA
ncbi:hypothetical protein VTG60DRAFT_5601 [Thermothelomyces hinnuleus]